MVRSRSLLFQATNCCTPLYPPWINLRRSRDCPDLPPRRPDKGDGREGRRGKKVAYLASHPKNFLAAVQVGVTLSGFLSAAFGADQLGDYLIPVLEGWGLSTNLAAGISLVLLTLVIAYSH